MTMKTNSMQGWLLKAFGVAAVATGLNAAPFLYTEGDLLLGIQSATDNNEFVANLGSYTSFLNGTANPTASYDPSRVIAAFGGNLDNISVSIFGGVDTDASPSTSFNTLFLTQARTDINVQTDPWLRKGNIAQGTTLSPINGVGNNSVAASGGLPPGVDNTATAVVIPSSQGTPVAGGIGTGDISGTFQGNIQGATSTGFSAGSSPLRLDLYSLQPGTTAGGTINTGGEYLGYFDFNPNGSLTFSAVPEPTTWGLIGLAGIMFIATQRLRRTNS